MIPLLFARSKLEEGRHACDDQQEMSQAVDRKTALPNSHGLFRRVSIMIATYMSACNKCRKRSCGITIAEPIRANMKSRTPIGIDRRIQRGIDTSSVLGEVLRMKYDIPFEYDVEYNRLLLLVPKYHPFVLSIVEST